MTTTQKKKNSPQKKRPTTRVRKTVVTSPPPTEPVPFVPYRAPVALAALPQVSWYETIATGFFSGYLPKAPGTWGSFFAAVFFFATVRYIPHQGGWQVGSIFFSWWAFVLASLATVVGIIASERLAAEWRQKDPGEIVIDEFAGLFFALLFVVPNFVGVISAFVYFRLFDILKPGPIGRVQNQPGGYGIVLDDVLAGLAAAPLALVTQLLFQKLFG